MREETTTAVQKMLIAVSGLGITLSDVSTIVTIFVGLATFVFVITNTWILLAKYSRWRKEKGAEKPLEETGPGAF